MGAGRSCEIRELMAWIKILFFGLSGCILVLILILLYSASQASIRHHGKLYSRLFFFNYRRGAVCPVLILLLLSRWRHCTV